MAATAWPTPATQPPPSARRARASDTRGRRRPRTGTPPPRTGTPRPPSELPRARGRSPCGHPRLLRASPSTNRAPRDTADAPQLSRPTPGSSRRRIEATWVLAVAVQAKPRARPHARRGCAVAADAARGAQELAPLAHADTERPGGRGDAAVRLRELGDALAHAGLVERCVAPRPRDHEARWLGQRRDREGAPVSDERRAAAASADAAVKDARSPATAV